MRSIIVTFSRNFWGKIRAAVVSLSFRYKILALVLAIIIFLGAAIALQTRAVLVTSLGQQLNQRSLATAKAVAAQGSELILTGNLYGLHQMLLDMQHSEPDVRYIFIQDSWGRVLSHTFDGGFPVDLLAFDQLPPGQKESQQVLVTDEGFIHDAAVPIFGGQLGVVHVGLSEAGLRQALVTATTRFVMMITLFAVLFITAAYLLTAVLTKPIRELVEATRAVARGNLEAPVAVSGSDEFGLLAASFNRMIVSLRHSRAEIEELSRLRSELLDRVVTAQEAERQRIARELHDGTGGALTAILLRLKALEDRVTPRMDPQGVVAELAEIRASLGEAMADLRRLAQELRPVVFDEVGLTGALQKIARDYSAKFNLQIHLAIRGVTGRLPPKVELTIYRMVQEALNNVIKHARASEVSILLEPLGTGLRLIVEDNGRGFIPATNGVKRGLGLFSMQERASLLGGKVTVESTPGRGTTIYADLPVTT